MRIDCIPRSTTCHRHRLRRSSKLYDLLYVKTRQGQRSNAGNMSESAQTMQVRYRLEGEVHHGSDATDVRLRLVNSKSGEQLWSESVALKEAIAAATQMRTLRASMEHLRRRLFTEEIRRVTTTSIGDPTAMDLVLRAASLDNEDKSLDRFHRQQALCDQALKLDPIWFRPCIASLRPSPVSSILIQRSTGKV